MRSFLLAAAFALTACGGPTPGTACSTAGYLCDDKNNAMECQVGVWVKLPCKGSGGCVDANGTVSCDMSGNAEGDACASSVVNTGQCSADGKATLECQSNASSGALTLVKTNTCSSCSATGTEILCQPAM
jgi:hypothetical protein